MKKRRRNGTPINTFDSAEPVPPTIPILDVVRAFATLRSAETKKVEALFAISAERLQMPDPASLDLGVHRWLMGRREENYSSWFAWCLEQLTPSEIIEIFQVSQQVDKNAVIGYPSCECEFWVSAGRERRAGRLDILLHLAPDSHLALELKLGSADKADTEKHRLYCDALSRLFPPGSCEAVLIATEGEKEDYDGFRLHCWRAVTLALRKKLPAVQNRWGATHAAMMAGFIHAVEENLLFVCKESPVLLVDYLHEFLESYDAQ